MSEPHAYRPPEPRVRIARRCWIPESDRENLSALCAAVLDSSPLHTVIASVTAALLHGLWLPPGLPDGIHVASAVPGAPGRLMTRTRRPEFVAHRFQLLPEDVTIVNGVPVTTMARTWRDLSRVLDVPDLVAAGDSALRAGVTLDELHALLATMPQAPSSRRARQAIPLLDARSRSRAESHLRMAVRGIVVPEFEVNVAVHRAEGGWLAEPDLSSEAVRIALEYQGADHAELARMRRDLSRAHDLRSERWVVLEYGPAEVFRRPAQVRAEVRRTAWERAPHAVRHESRRMHRR